MKYVEGKKYFSNKINGRAKELLDIGYPIPDYATNQYHLDNLLTNRSERADRVTRREYEEL